MPALLFRVPFALITLTATIGVAPAIAQDTNDPCAFETVVDLRSGTPTSPARLFGEAGGTQLVFLGEHAGVPEHVTLASCLLEAKTGSRPPVLALEHLPANVQRDLDTWRSETRSDVASFADVVSWDELGQGDLELYLPLIETASNARAHVIATDIPLPGAGGTSFETLLETSPLFGLQTQDIVAAWVPDLIAEACDAIGEGEAERLALESMERHQIMAGRLVAGRGRGPSTLFFGDRDHVRMDRSVPYLIARTDRPPSMLTIAAFTSADWEALQDDLSALQGVYDVVVIAGDARPDAARGCR